MNDATRRHLRVRPKAALTALMTCAAMLAFAANSILCRLALGEQSIDAASFTSVRIASGALILWLLGSLRSGSVRPAGGSRHSAAALFVYMIGFSYAYNSLGAGTGALILFGAVQLTMFGGALRRGERPPARGWVGLTMAAAGLVYLISPGATAPALSGAVLMAIAGIAWGIYSLRGRGSTDPLAATAGNFLYCVPAAILVSLLSAGTWHGSSTGLLLAAASGAFASGLGYAIWYTALRGLSATSAATVQLSVPVIAAFGGVALLAEPVTLRLILASLATLGGIGIALLPQRAPTQGS